MTRWDVPDAIWESDNSYDVPVLNPRYQADAVDLPFVAWGSVAVYHRKETRQMNKVDILQTWANHLATAAQQGALTGRPCPISRIETVTGQYHLFSLPRRFLAMVSARRTAPLPRGSCAVRPLR